MPSTEKTDKQNPLDFGEIIVTKGQHKGRIGYYDDDDSPRKAVVYFCHPTMIGIAGYYLINSNYLRLPSTQDLLERKQKIDIEWAKTHINHVIKKQNNSYTKDLDIYLEKTILEAELAYFHEYHYINEILNWRIRSRNKLLLNNGKKIFISHASGDKHFVRRVVDDLKIRGHDVWFDETHIDIGDCIPSAIQKGLNESSYVLLFLSKKSVSSRWVEVEWMNKFLEEIENKEAIIMPVLIEKCSIPTLLKSKKYADFTKDYNEALLDILNVWEKKSAQA